MVGQDFQRRFRVFALINRRATGAGDRSEECVRVIVTKMKKTSVVDPTMGDIRALLGNEAQESGFAIIVKADVKLREFGVSREASHRRTLQ